MTLSELAETVKRRRDLETQRFRQPWEIMRLQVAMTIQPFVKATIDPKKILPLPWDKQRKTPAQQVKEKKMQKERLKHYLTTGEWPD